MFLVRLEGFDPLVDATSRLAQIAKEADVIFTPLSLRIMASNHAPPFVAMLDMSCQCFAVFSVNDHHCSSLSLESLHDVMLDCVLCSTMTFHLTADTDQLVLRFEDSNRKLEFKHELSFVPQQEKEMEEIDYAKYFFVDSRGLRRVLEELPIFKEDPVLVTATDSQVKFSIDSKEIIFTKEGGQYEVVGFGKEEESRIQIILNPLMFFLNLTYDVYRVSFYKTKLKSYGVMIFPAFGQVEAEYLLYFPQNM